MQSPLSSLTQRFQEALRAAHSRGIGHILRYTGHRHKIIRGIRKSLELNTLSNRDIEKVRPMKRGPENGQCKR